MTERHLLAFMSPAGSTRRMAKAMADELHRRERTVEILDLGTEEGRTAFPAQAESLDATDCLWLGSPVYAGSAVWPLMEMLQALRPRPGLAVVPFVTYGRVNSGFAMQQMVAPLLERGCLLMGGAKIMALHSLMWTEESPFGAGRPDGKDESLVRELVGRVLARRSASPPESLTLDDLDVHPADHPGRGEVWAAAKFRGLFPRPVIDGGTCTGCGTCARNCPMQNVDGASRPPEDRCVACLNCVRLCPTGAARSPMTAVIPTRVREFARSFDETVETRIF